MLTCPGDWLGGAHRPGTPRPGITRVRPEPAPHSTPLALGVATASYQIEGATTEDGRGPSIWDTFARARARSSTATTARSPATPTTVSTRTSRSSAASAWSLPLLDRLAADRARGPRRVETRGLDYYERLVDGLLERGIDADAHALPLGPAAGARGRGRLAGARHRRGVRRLRRGGRTSGWATGWPPGRPTTSRGARPTSATPPACTRRAPGAGGRTAPRTTCCSGTRWPRRGCRPRARRSASCSTWRRSGRSARRPRRSPTASTPSATGSGSTRWSTGRTRAVLAVAPVLADPSWSRRRPRARSQGSADWLGVNYYTPVRPASPAGARRRTRSSGAYPGVATFDLVVREPRTDIGWEVEPPGSRTLLATTAGAPACRSSSPRTAPPCRRRASPTAGCDDQDRIDYLREPPRRGERARGAGADVRGYFAWTLLDNFEWAEGYAKTFGLVARRRPRTSRTRTPKASYHWFADQRRARRGVPRRRVAQPLTLPASRPRTK